MSRSSLSISILTKSNFAKPSHNHTMHTMKAFSSLALPVALLSQPAASGPIRRQASFVVAARRPFGAHGLGRRRDPSRQRQGARHVHQRNMLGEGRQSSIASPVHGKHHVLVLQQGRRWLRRNVRIGLERSRTIPHRIVVHLVQSLWESQLPVGVRALRLSCQKQTPKHSSRLLPVQYL